MKYTVIKISTRETVLENVDEETALSFLKISRRLLSEKVVNDEPVRKFWRVEGIEMKESINGPNEKFGKSWVEWFIKKWNDMRKRYGLEAVG